MLAGNIFHRAVILGPSDKARAGVKLDGLTGLVFRRGAQIARQEDLQANIGNIVDIVAHVAGTLAANGERLRAGDVIITGSIVPPPMIEKDETEFAYALDPMPRLSVQLLPLELLHVHLHAHDRKALLRAGAAVQRELETVFAAVFAMRAIDHAGASARHDGAMLRL